MRAVEGKSAANLRVVLDNNSLVLRQVELNLSALTAGARLGVERAFAAELRVHIPWGSIASAPLEVTLSGVEVVLVQDDDAAAPGPEGAPAALPAAVVPAAASGEPGEEEEEDESLLLALGALNSFDFTLLHADVQLRRKGGTVRAVCASATAHNVPLEAGAPSEQLDWLRKSLVLADLSLSTALEGAEAPFVLLHAQSAHVHAILPLFAAEAGAEEARPFRLRLALGPRSAACGAEQLALLKSALGGAPAVAAASATPPPPPRRVVPPLVGDADEEEEGEAGAGADMSDHYADALARVMGDKLALETRLAQVEADQRELEMVNTALTQALQRQGEALELLITENAAYM